MRLGLGDYAQACPEALLRQDLAGVAGEVACLWPELARRVGTSTTPPLAVADAERFRLFESLDTWVQRIAARHPLLLILDDLHWADGPSLLLLRHLMQARRSTPLLAVAMYRDVERETGGNPFFLLEMARHLSQLGAFDREAAEVAVRHFRKALERLGEKGEYSATVRTALWPRTTTSYGGR